MKHPDMALFSATGDPAMKFRQLPDWKLKKCLN